MTREETGKILGYIKGAFPKYYYNIDAQTFKQQIITWTDVLKDYPIDRVFMGVKSYISAEKDGFPPSPGQIIEYMHRAENPGNRSGIDAWRLVCRAINSPRDQMKAAFATLPETIQHVLGSPDTLLAWGNVDTEHFETVIQSNFLRSYEAQVRREHIEHKIPENLRISLDRPEPPKIEGPKSVEYDDAFDSTEVEMPKSVSDRLAALKAKLGQ